MLEQGDEGDECLVHWRNSDICLKYLLFKKKYKLFSNVELWQMHDFYTIVIKGTIYTPEMQGITTKKNIITAYSEPGRHLPKGYDR